MTTGIVRGQYQGNIDEFYQKVREAWFENVLGLTVKNRPMISLDVDEPLWHLSKYGCSKKRNKMTGKCSLIEVCEAREYCVSGRVKIDKNQIELDT